MRLPRLTLPLLVLAMPVASAADTRLFEMRVYYAAPGKLDALNARFRDHTLKLFEKHGITNVGYFVPAENPDNRLIYILAYKDLEARTAAWAAFRKDPAWQSAQKASEVNGKLVAKVDEIYLTPTDYSPIVEPKLASPERVFELRTYTTPAGKLDNLHARFRDHTLKLFEKHGMTNVGYWTLATAPGVKPATPAAIKALGGKAGPDAKLPEVTMIYLLAHPSAEARDKAFAAFRADPVWVEARAASEKAAGGSLTVPEGFQSLMMKPTDYSPMR